MPLTRRTYESSTNNQVGLELGRKRMKKGGNWLAPG